MFFLLFFHVYQKLRWATFWIMSTPRPTFYPESFSSFFESACLSKCSIRFSFVLGKHGPLPTCDIKSSEVQRGWNSKVCQVPLSSHLGIPEWKWKQPGLLKTGTVSLLLTFYWSKSQASKVQGRRDGCRIPVGAVARADRDGVIIHCWTQGHRNRNTGSRTPETVCACV